MKKILYIYHTSAIGGGSYCLLNILKELDRSRFEASVLLANNGPLVEEIRKLNIDVFFYDRIQSVPYNSTLLKPKRIWNLSMLQFHFQKYVKIVKSIKPDIVYVNSMMLYPFLFIKKYYDCKTIIHIREHWPEGEHKWQRDFAETTIAKYADEVIAINKYSAGMFKSLRNRCKVVYDWIDLNQRNQNFTLHQVFDDLTNDTKVFLFTGGYVPIKGLRDVLMSFSHIDRRDIRLLLLGQPPAESFTGLRRLKKYSQIIRGRKTYIQEVKELIEADNRIKCIPGTYNIKQILELCSCMVSFFKIPHANLALAECIIAGTPVIAADTEEAREYSADGNAAMLFDFDSSDSFIANVLNYLSQPELENTRVRKYSAEVKNLFDPRRNAKILDKIYSNI